MTYLRIVRTLFVGRRDQINAIITGRINRDHTNRMNTIEQIENIKFQVDYSKRMHLFQILIEAKLDAISALVNAL